MFDLFDREERIALFEERSRRILDSKVVKYTRIDMWEYFDIIFSRSGELELQEWGYEHYYDKHYNAIVMSIQEGDNGQGTYGKNYLVTKNNPFPSLWQYSTMVITSPVTYVGRNRTAKNARLCYGICIDLDGVGLPQIRDILHQQGNGSVPKPNIMVNSGNGVHVYYLFERPIALFDESKRLLGKLKHALTSCVWNMYSSSIKDQQYQGIFQGFRIPDTQTKFGTYVEGFRTRLEDRPYYTIAELRNYGAMLMRLNDAEADFLDKARYFPAKISLKQAQELYPDWYERRVVRGEARGRWHIKRDLYDWWLDRMRLVGEVKEGHRYFCVMTLAMYALKCDVPFEELERDAMTLLEPFDEITGDQENHFTEEDIRDALKAYQECYATFPRDTISKLTGIFIMPNKRNNQRQRFHLEEARMIRDLRMSRTGRRWDDNRGRKKGSVISAEDSPKAKLVREWRAKNPDNCNKSQCSRETGLTRPTVIKWWDS